MPQVPDTAGQQALPDYYNRVNADLLDAIPPDARVVLEVGCGTGAMGERFRRRNPRCRYLGIELHSQAAQRAAQRLDAVVAGDASTVSTEQLGLRPREVDCLVYGDVLEHLADPWATLRRHAEWLADGGVVVACVPNVQHWTVLRDLAAGSWRYRDEGLLDRTHLRFFTRSSLPGLFDQAGLQIAKLRRRLVKIDEAAFDAFARTLEPAARAAGVTDLTTWRLDLRTVQYVVTATRRPVSTLLIQALTLSPVAAVNTKRIEEPLRFLGALPEVLVRSQGQHVDLNLGSGHARKVLLWQRPILTRPESTSSLRRLLQAGYLIVVEFDDDPARWPQIAAHDYLTFAGVHAVQTTTDELAGFLSRFNPNIAVFPNQMAELPPPREFRDTENVRLFFGALNRQEDWEAIHAPLFAAIEAERKRLEAVVVHDRAFFDRLPLDHKRFYPTTGYADYLALLQTCDIGLLPLRDTQFNRYKSDLKFIEHAACGTVALASRVVYGATVRDGETGVLFSSPEELVDRLLALIRQTDWRRGLARNGYAWVLEHRLLSDHFRKRLEWYASLLSDKPRLDSELLRRVPELAAHA